PDRLLRFVELGIGDAFGELLERAGAEPRFRVADVHGFDQRRQPLPAGRKLLTEGLQLLGGYETALLLRGRRRGRRGGRLRRRPSLCVVVFLRRSARTGGEQHQKQYELAKRGRTAKGSHRKGGPVILGALGRGHRYRAFRRKPSRRRERRRDYVRP